MTQPIAWTIAGSDSSGCAGIQTDLKTFQQLGVHGCSVITAVTAQNTSEFNHVNFLSPETILAQLHTLHTTLYPNAIKIGMLGSASLIPVLSKFNGHVVLDPLIKSSSQNKLFYGEEENHFKQLTKLFPYISILTPNKFEAEKMVGYSLKTASDIEAAAQEIITRGVKSVLIKGGHFDDAFSQDYWTNGQDSFWLANKRQLDKTVRGTGCSLSSAITACLALGYEIKDAIVIAKMYINQAIRLSSNTWLTHSGWPENEEDLPYLSAEFLRQSPKPFSKLESNVLGLYPVVDSSTWLKTLLPLGVKTIQLRIKNKSGCELENEIKLSVELAKKYGATLFVNDYWELAIKHGAYGVHLGQEDLLHANFDAIRKNKLRLGISTHCYYEVARAHSLQPSYIACGPIFPTTSKIMPFDAQGIEKLNRWRRTLRYPLVAIGGINLEKISQVLATKVDGIALISAITQASNPELATQQLLSAMGSV